jgi:hypothetical protein
VGLGRTARWIEQGSFEGGGSVSAEPAPPSPAIS